MGAVPGSGTLEKGNLALMKRKKLVSTALLGLAASVGMAFPAAANAEPIDLGESIRVCLVAYEAAGDWSDIDTLNDCIDEAVVLYLADMATEQSIVEDAAMGTPSVDDVVVETSTDGGNNTAELGAACGDGSVNTGILGSAGCSN